MKRTIPTLTAFALAALAATACERHITTTSTTTPGPSASTTVTTTTPTSPTNAPTTADTASPNAPASSTTITTTTSSPAGATNVVTDTIVSGKVKAAIAADSNLKDSDLTVKTENGVVTITGTVKSPEQATLVAAVAQRQEGVNRVENSVAVK